MDDESEGDKENHEAPATPSKFANVDPNSLTVNQLVSLITKSHPDQLPAVKQKKSFYGMSKTHALLLTLVQLICTNLSISNPPAPEVRKQGKGNSSIYRL